MANLQKQFLHDQWANAQVLSALREIGGPPSAVAEMAHLLTAQTVWLARIGGEDTVGAELWPKLSLEECGELMTWNSQHYNELLGDLVAEDLDEIINYTTTKGVPQAQPLSEIFHHLLLHGAHHRGKINLLAIIAGGRPVAVDYIAYAIQQSAGAAIPTAEPVLS
jgi:uncharacterized damage-inducible protein DinB